MSFDSLQRLFGVQRSAGSAVALVAPDSKASEDAFRDYALAVKAGVEAGTIHDPARATLHTEVKVIDATKGIVDYIASDETLDSYREAIKASGWQFSRFKKNAPFVDSHDYSTIGQLVGMVTDYAVRGGQLVERVQWAIDVPENELAAFGFKMTVAGYLKAVSVGFIPVKMSTRWDGDESAWQAAVASLKLSASDAAIVRCIYLAQEQYELSTCIIGANGNAVAKAYKGGALSDSDLDKLADIGQKTLSRFKRDGSRIIVKSTRRRCFQGAGTVRFSPRINRGRRRIATPYKPLVATQPQRSIADLRL